MYTAPELPFYEGTIDRHDSYYQFSPSYMKFADDAPGPPTPPLSRRKQNRQIQGAERDRCTKIRKDFTAREPNRFLFLNPSLALTKPHSEIFWIHSVLLGACDAHPSRSKAYALAKLW
ncbi:hypothetical protein RRG08_026277 [Elysia crispata]|uniref:Uncharacterized protein n=1 Tax=Elysia crispata TaxID=231223 RepID=A0AAE0ZCA8_9GAST|nr:hypothetical protein RRG08_026277 [Elysia crispata]